MQITDITLLQTKRHKGETMFLPSSSSNQVFLNIPMFRRIQNIYYNLLIHSLQRHCKVFVLRIDIHLPQEIAQRVITDFNRRFIEKEKNAGYDPLYIMVREYSSEKHIHYHMGLFFDGNRTNNPYQHFQNARIVLGNICGSYGCINECNDGHRNGIMLERNTVTYNDLFEVLIQFSYLAKIKTKEDVPGKTFFYSKGPILPLGNEDVTRYFQSLFPNLTFGMTNWYAS